MYRVKSNAALDIKIYVKSSHGTFLDAVCTRVEVLCCFESHWIPLNRHMEKISANNSIVRTMMARAPAEKM